jgi:peptidyl-prolyl cis-trans isomerase A (cyclophilin A)
MGALVGLTLGAMAGCSPSGGEQQSEADAVPLFHTPRRAAATAPDTFLARFETSKGEFTVRAVREWAPLGADRFYTLVSSGYYDDLRFYRVVDDFMVEWGLHGDARVTTLWRRYGIPDDTVRQSNLKGRLSFAAHGPNSRTVQIFVNLRDNAGLDAQGFAPFAEVVEGMEVVESLYSEYGDGPPRGDGPYQARALARGNVYLDADFPDLDTLVRAVVIDESILQ